MASTMQVCPIVGTTSSILPPSHPDFDINVGGQVCPVTNATTDHHHNLSKHPSVSNAGNQNLSDAASCPALKNVINNEQNQALDEGICPVIGPASTVLPPDHPSTADAEIGAVCPITKASLTHHKGKVVEHPKVDAASGAKCPVVGATMKA